MTSQFWQALCAKLQIKHFPTTAYHPQANGLAERTNQTMKQLLRIAQMEGTTWFDALPLTEIAMNNAPLPQSHMTPFYLNYGYHPNFDADIFDSFNPWTRFQRTHTSLLRDYTEIGQPPTS